MSLIMSNEEESHGPVGQGNIKEFIRRVRSVIDDYTIRMVGSDPTPYSQRATLRDFTRSIIRLEDGVDRFEHGAPAEKRVPYENVTRKRQGAGDGDIEEEHESFGLVRFNRVSGGVRLFGSHLEQHQHYITMAVSRAKVCHGLSYDRYHPTDHLIEIKLSAAQFAEAITSLNSGVGAPCTIYEIGRVLMEPVPVEAQAEHQKIREGFEEKIDETAIELEKARDDWAAILDGSKTISKGRAREMLKVLTHAAQELRKNAPFVVNQFRESADKVVTSAKAEIEAFAQVVLTRAGMAAIARGDMPKLLLGERETPILTDSTEVPETLPAGPVEFESCPDCGEEYCDGECPDEIDSFPPSTPIG